MATSKNTKTKKTVKTVKPETKKKVAVKKKRIEDAAVKLDNLIDDYVLEVPNKTLRSLYWSLTVDYFKLFIKSLFKK